MTNIGFFALGGLGEYGKNMYVVEVDEQLFILDAGLKYPTSELLGIDEIIPDYTMLIPAKKRIKGLFITHAHEDHIGAIPHIIKNLNVPIYASGLALAIIKDDLIDKKIDLNQVELHEINKNSKLNFGNVTISFCQMSHSIPEALAIFINTPEGGIFYTSEFTLDQSSEKIYQTDFQKLNKIANEDILLLLNESIGAMDLPLAGANLIFENKLENIFIKAPGRIIVTLFSSDLKKIQKIVDKAISHDKKIAIIGRKAQRIVDIAIKNGYLSIPKDRLVNLRFINDKNRNNDPNLVCLVTGQRHEPFFMLQRIVNKVDRLINLEDKDTVILLTSPVPGTEKMAARTLDILYRTNASIISIDKQLLSISHSNASEIKLLINLLNPKYIIPAIGEYRHQATVKKLATQMGFMENNILLLDNGDVFKYKNNKCYVSKEDVRAGDIYIDGTPIIDDNDVVMNDRALLADNGFLSVIANISPQTKQILGKPEVFTQGFVYRKDNQELEKKILEIFYKISEKQLTKKFINWNEYKQQLKKELSGYLYKITGRNPMIIPVLIATELNKHEN